MIFRRHFLTVTAAAAVSLSLFTAPVLASTDAPSEFVRGLATQAISSLTDKSVDRSKRIERFREMFNNHFAVKGIGKWVLGRYWRRATEEQKTDYMTLFEDLMVVSYVDRFADYAGESLDIVKSLPNNKTTSTVFSEIRRPGATQPIRVDWRVAASKKAKDGFKIVDVVVEGTSMSTTLRSDFGSIIRKSGGQVGGLLEALRKKTAALNAAQ